MSWNVSFHNFTISVAFVAFLRSSSVLADVLATKVTTSRGYYYEDPLGEKKRDLRAMSRLL